MTCRWRGQLGQVQFAFFSLQTKITFILMANTNRRTSILKYCMEQYCFHDHPKSLFYVLPTGRIFKLIEFQLLWLIIIDYPYFSAQFKFGLPQFPSRGLGNLAGTAFFFEKPKIRFLLFRAGRIRNHCWAFFLRHRSCLFFGNFLAQLKFIIVVVIEPDSTKLKYNVIPGVS